MTPSNLPISQDAAFGIIPICCPPGGTLEDAEFLLIKHNAGHWAFPKGHAEGNETPLESAKREFTEETGINNFKTIESVSFKEQYEIHRTRRIIHKVVVYYPAFLEKETVTIQEAEIADYCWEKYDAARQIITYSASILMFEEVYQYLQQHPELFPGA